MNYSLVMLKVTFFKTTHSIPDSVAICIHTTDGVIVYTSDFTFDQNAKGRYQTNYGRMSEIAKEGVLCLLSESLNAEKSGFTSTGNSLQCELDEAFSPRKWTYYLFAILIRLTSYSISH